MDPVGGIFLLLAGAAWYWFVTGNLQTQARIRREAAEAAGITGLEHRRFLGWATQLTGRYGPLRVELAGSLDNKDKSTRVRVGGLLPGLTLRLEKRGRARGDAATGDAVFDYEVEVHGSDASLRALLDKDTRQLVHRMLEGSLDATVVGLWSAPCWFATIENGELRLQLPPHQVPATLAQALKLALAIAQRLVRPEDVPARLAEHARSDPKPGVREQNLMALVRDYADHPLTREALAAARRDGSDTVRLRAALALGREGRDLLLEIASAEDSDDGSAGRAVAALGVDLPGARALEVLWHALRRRRVHCAEACLAWLGWHGKDSAIEPLAKVLTIEQGELGVAAVNALGVSGLPAAEAPLLRALAGEAPAMRAAAAEALGEMGSAAAVWPLKEAAAQHPDDTALAQAARQAVAAIQSRLSGTPGQLSLAQGEAGQLDLADEGASGRLSLARPDPPKSGG